MTAGSAPAPAPSPGEAFARLHPPGAPLLLPNAWDAVSGAALAAQGHPALGTTSLGVAAVHGLPDAAGATREQTVALARQLLRLGPLVSVDVEHGFSEDPAEVADLAAQLAGLGVAGINLEDGRADGTLVAAERHARVVAAVKACAPGLFVNARTDVLWVDPGGPLAEARERARRYLDAGADGAFVPGLAEEAGIAALAEALPAPLNVLLSPAGPPLPRLAALGVRRASFGSALVRAALGAALDAVAAVRAGGPLRLPPGTPSYREVERLTATTLEGWTSSS